MTAAAADVGAAVAGYAATMHGVVGGGHHVASPLGAWLVLALCAPATAGREREVLTGVLGARADEAAATAAGLLAAPHPLVAAAAAVWNRPGTVGERWLAGLPAVVDRGGIPSQAEADDWARRRTSGLIEKFPIVITAQIYLLIASALATKVSWDCPFELAPGSALGASSPWARELAQVLRTPDHHGHDAFIAATEQAGDVAVHTGRARGGLLVTSVIAADGVPAGQVLAAAHELARAQARQQRVSRRSLFDLPLGDGPLWSISELRSDSGDKERCTAVLPAWSARSDYDLSDERLGFAAAAQALGEGDPWQARQAATASYTRVGFEAGAVTAMAIMLAAMLPRRGRLRRAELRFGHPYAVVAVAADDPSGRGSHYAGASPWHGLPVFSAWVTRPRDAADGGPEQSG